jgi:hypothetical protein
MCHCSLQGAFFLIEANTERSRTLQASDSRQGRSIAWTTTRLPTGPEQFVAANIAPRTVPGVPDSRPLRLVSRGLSSRITVEIQSFSRDSVLYINSSHADCLEKKIVSARAPPRIFRKRVRGALRHRH